MGAPQRTSGAIHKSDRAFNGARRMRAPTRSEAALWKILRELGGLHFRRQAPFGPYVVDFVCHRARLVVEVDGGIHDLAAVKARDERRDAWLAARAIGFCAFPTTAWSTTRVQ
ncbi:MAG: endonuclease domain-containing protein [Caulobacteraceae bacterium]